MANTFKVLKSAISRLWKMYQKTPNVDDRPHSGRTWATTGAQPRVVPIHVLTNRHIAHILECGMECQNWGIRRWSRVMFSDEPLFTLNFLDRSGVNKKNGTPTQNAISSQIWRWIGYGVGWYHYDYPPYSERKGHCAVLPGQHTDTICRPVC